MFSNLKKIVFILWEEIAFKLTFCCMLITCTIHLHCQTLEKMYGLLFCFWVQSCTGIASLVLGYTVGLTKKAKNWMRQQKTLLFKTFQWQVIKLLVPADQWHQRHVYRLCHHSPSPDYDSTCFAGQFCDVT